MSLAMPLLLLRLCPPRPHHRAHPPRPLAADTSFRAVRPASAGGRITQLDHAASDSTIRRSPSTCWARARTYDAVAELVLDIVDVLRALADVVAAERVSWRFSLLHPRGY